MLISLTLSMAVYFSDADSGRYNGVKFRIANIDAPETTYRARCEREKELGYIAKEWVVSYTRGKRIEFTHDYGADRYGRRVVDISVSGRDLGKVGVRRGKYKAWPHRRNRALTAKPHWCGRSVGPF